MRNPIMNLMTKSENNVLNSILSNPDFQKFARENKGLKPEQIANKYGLNINDLYKLINTK